MYDNEVLKLLYNNLYYPDFVKWFDSLSVAERNILSGELDAIINKEYDDGYEEAMSEQEDGYDLGYENGQTDATIFAEDTIIKFVEDLELRDKLLEELQKENDES